MSAPRKRHTLGFLRVRAADESGAPALLARPSDLGVPDPAVLVFAGIAVGTTTAIAIVSVAMGWSVSSPAWSVLAPVAMWVPALGRLVAVGTVDRGLRSPPSLRRWGTTGVQVILWPVIVPLVVYGAAYSIASGAGLAHWSPGGGSWTTGSQIAANVIVNAVILGVVGTLTAMGEEIGWRGYLQPRLDVAGVRWSVAVVWLCQLAYHAPLIAGAGYVNAGSLPASTRSMKIFWQWRRPHPRPLRRGHRL